MYIVVLLCILEAEIVLGVLHRKGGTPKKGGTLGSPDSVGSLSRLQLSLCETLQPEKITCIKFLELISCQITFQLHKHTFLGLISSKLHYMSSFGIQGSTWKHHFGIIFLGNASHLHKIILDSRNRALVIGF